MNRPELSDQDIKKLLKTWEQQLELSKNEIKTLRAAAAASDNTTNVMTDQQLIELTNRHTAEIDRHTVEVNRCTAEVDRCTAEIESLKINEQVLANKLTDVTNELTKERQVNSELVDKLKEMRVLFLKESAARKGIHEDLMNIKGKIRIFVRVRPDVGSNTDVIPINYISEETDMDHSMVISDLHLQKNVKFNFDAIFEPNTTQTQVYDHVKPFLTSVMDGVNVTLLAYGQTGSGKTYTMQGTPEDPGVNIRSLNSIFELSKQREDSWTYTFSVTILEIYLEQLFDLLTDKKEKNLDIKMHPDTKHNYCPGITTINVQTAEDMHMLLKIANENRTVAKHNMNEHSSRSHLVFTLDCVGVSLHGGKSTRSKLTLVDLAGSERINKTDVHGDQLKEAQSINKSLSALGDVIAALGSGSGGHVPYRNSKLTYLLQDQFSGSGKLGFFANCHQTSSNLQETMFTLKFAERCRSIELRSGMLGGGGNGGALNKKKPV